MLGTAFLYRFLSVGLNNTNITHMDALLILGDMMVGERRNGRTEWGLMGI